MIKTDIVEIYCNGEKTDSAELTEDSPRGLFYFENEGVYEELSAGKTEKQRDVEYLTRAAITYFNAAIQTVDDISNLDETASETLLDDFYRSLLSEDEDGDEAEDEDEDTVSLGGGLYCTRNAFDRFIEAFRSTGETVFTADGRQLHDGLADPDTGK